MNISIVGGAGRVGLPLALVLAERGFNVDIVDSDITRVEQINNKVMPFIEIGAQEILDATHNIKLKADTSLSVVKGSEVCILVIGTPVHDSGTPATEIIFELIKEIKPYLSQTKILILRSTVFPGITRKIKEYLLKNNLQLEVAYCPERLIEGNAIYELKNLPQVIGVDSYFAFDLASKIFEQISPEVIQTTPEEAEIMKLFANSLRYLQFSIANEFFEICIKKNIDWENVWFALKHNYARAASLPLPGFAAGPCLVKDTQQLNHFYDNNFILGKSALAINEELPDFLISKLEQIIDISDKTVGILGMTFKGQVDDFRQSLSFRLKRVLSSKVRNVICSDSQLQKKYFVETNELLELSDIIIIASPHNEYKTLVTDKPIIDIWRITQNASLI
jgi:UDP-N-acetyl-D-mannosaminuronic acid dehydrogenase